MELDVLFIYNANLDKQLLGFKVVGVHTARMWTDTWNWDWSQCSLVFQNGEDLVPELVKQTSIKTEQPF